MEEARQKARRGVVVGMAALTGETKPRQRYDIDVMLQVLPDTFNLFLQALSRLQEDKGLLGYFSLSGIHGLPSSTWDEVEREIEDKFSGYCAHGVMAFPTWHRPYLALLEQTIYLKMVDIANNDYDKSLRQKYLDAAKAFRLPYYDYFRPRGRDVTFPGVIDDNFMTSFPYDFTLPTIFNEQEVAITKPPLDAPGKIQNPLYAYKFSEEHGQLEGDDFDNFAASYNTSQTVRHPKNRASTVHGTKSLSDSLNSGREARCSYSLDLLNSKPYMQAWQFVTDNKRLDGALFTVDLTKKVTVDGRGSIEDLHNKYHGLIGKGGVMGNPTVAAFDPIFFFHHCNIDRYWALWQVLHPQEWFPQPRPGAQATPENKKKLYPFYKSKQAPGDGDFYDPDDTRSTEAFGYIYDDLKGFNGDTNAFWQRFRKNYIWQIRLPNNPDFNKIPSNMVPLDFNKTRFSIKSLNLAGQVSATVAAASDAVAVSAARAAEIVPEQAQVVLQAVPANLVPAPDLVPVTTRFSREWYVDSTVKRHAANGTFSIYFFLAGQDKVSDDVSTYMHSPYLAGINHIFAAPREFCDNCGRQDDVGQLASDTHPITPLLLDYLNRTDNHLDSLEPEHVRPFLVKNLRWRVVYHGQDDKDPRDIPDLVVGVSAKHYTDDEGNLEYEDYPDIVAEIIRNASASAGAHAT